MALTTGQAVTAKEAFARGEFLVGDQWKIGLFRANASLGRAYGPAAGVKYTDITAAVSDEVASGGGYTTGGIVLATTATGPNNATPTVITATGAWYNWTTNPAWTSATFVASGCFIYNNTHANKLIVGIYDFGGDRSVSAGTLTLVMPTAGQGTAILVFN